MKIINKFREKYLLFNFTTDIIVGFPGETDAEFAETLDVIKKVGFSHIHTFKYSRRTGTRADRMTDHINEKVKNERSTMVRELSETLKFNYRSRFLGKEQTILIERNNSKGGARGYGEHYIPLVVIGHNLTRNNFYRVKPVSLLQDKEVTLAGELIAVS